MTVDERTILPDWHPPAAVPPTMLACTIREFGAPEVLRMEEVATPSPGPGEVLVRVAAVCVGRLLDVVARAGRHPFAKFEFPHVFGAEHAGTVVALGEDVHGASVGDRVAVFPLITSEPDDELSRAGYPELSPSSKLIGTHLPGAYAQYVAVPVSNVRPVPEGVSPVEAASLVLAAAVAANQFRHAGGVGPGSRVLVPGATSALSSTAALFAKHLGAKVVVTSRDAQKREALAALGFDGVVDTAAGDFAEQVVAAFDGEPATLVIDNLGLQELYDREFEVLAPGGTIVTSGAFLGSELTLDIKQFYLRGQRLVGVRTGNLSSLDIAWEQVQQGFRTVIDSVFPLDRAADAHRYVESSSNAGRVVLHVS